LQLKSSDFIKVKSGNLWHRLWPSSSQSPALEWFKVWLARTQAPYDPSPYQQVITFLQKIGDSIGADFFYVESKNRERDRACDEMDILNFSGCFYLWAAFLVGYGRHLFIAVHVSTLFIVVGAFVFRGEEKPKFKSPYLPFASPSGTESRIKVSSAHIPLRWAYSFDMFIPLVKLRDRHYKDVDFSGKIRYYLYAHKLAGWVLGSFIVASIVSLTK
jgi:hypothetical protein